MLRFLVLPPMLLPVLLPVLLASGCGATRKISKVGLREPASVSEGSAITALRARMSALVDVPKACPKQVREQFAPVAAARVNPPPCPPEFSERVLEAYPLLRSEERSALDEIVSTQCRSLGGPETSLASLVSSFESSGPMGRLQAQGSNDRDQKILRRLQASLQELTEVNLALQRWVKRNGPNVLSEEELGYFSRLVVDRRCDLSEAEIDQSYRMIRGLEGLAEILPAGETRARIETLLEGLHQIIDGQVKEFFHP